MYQYVLLRTSTYQYVRFCLPVILSRCTVTGFQMEYSQGRVGLPLAVRTRRAASEDSDAAILVCQPGSVPGQPEGTGGPSRGRDLKPGA